MRHFRTSRRASGPSPSAFAQRLDAARKAVALFSLASAALVLGGCQMLFGDFEERPASATQLVCDKSNASQLFKKVDGKVDTKNPFETCGNKERCIKASVAGEDAFCAQCQPGASECTGVLGAFAVRLCGGDGTWQAAPTQCDAEQRCSEELGCFDCSEGERRCVQSELAVQVCNSQRKWETESTCGVFEGGAADCVNLPWTDAQDSREGYCRRCSETERKCVTVTVGDVEFVRPSLCKDGKPNVDTCECDPVTSECIIE